MMFPRRVLIHPRADADAGLDWQFGLGSVCLPNDFWNQVFHRPILKLRLLTATTENILERVTAESKSLFLA